MLKSQRKRVAIAIVVAVVVDLVVATAVAVEVAMTDLIDLDSNLKAEDEEATIIRLEDRPDVPQTLNLVVEAIFQDQEKAVENKPLC